MSIIPTVKIKSGRGYAIINKSDFDEKTHTLWSEPKKKPAPKKKVAAKKKTS